MITPEYITYSDAIQEGFDYLLENYPEVVVMGQGLWSPWYVGDTMKNLEKKYGKDRLIDTPVSESAVTGAALGASLRGMKTIVVHPRMDFMMYCIDSIVNQAAKWSYMFGGKAVPNMTIRGIINRGGEQGPQHSQALHAWFAHIPGLRVLMPYSPNDARDMLISSVLSPGPTLYIDDRWLYQTSEKRNPIQIYKLNELGPKIVCGGGEITVVAAGYSTHLAREAISQLTESEGQVELIDVRALNPFDPKIIINSVLKTHRLLVIDGGWRNCGFAGEIIASVMESEAWGQLNSKPQRITLPESPAPSSSILEGLYYPTKEIVKNKIIEMIR